MKDMKDFVNTVIAITCIAIVIMSMPVMAMTTRQYMSVTKIENETIEVIDAKGNLWSFTGDGFEVGDRVIVDMYNNGTKEIYDDEIRDVKKLQ